MKEWTALSSHSRGMVALCIPFALDSLNMAGLQRCLLAPAVSQQAPGIISYLEAASWTETSITSSGT